ncbi:MAG: DNA polymerase III subunit delta [Hyphomicrobiaceae bacterium]|nr:DNA polymerase III subunit delta [Bauldia sp.]MCB1547422.1 DNA polymerase III subunit delta [Hyphomicrobiaceae bacterium]
MAEVKTDIDRFLSRTDVGLLLIHGNDTGLVAERAAAFTRATLGSSADPLGLIRLEASEVSSDPARLADEAYAIPMFGGRRCIELRVSGNWQVLPALQPLFANPPVDSALVVTAGELRKTSPVRKLFEQAKHAYAIACYADDARALDRVIDEETARAGLTIAGDARAALKQLIGSDRMASRGEVSKLCLYAEGAGEITLDDVRAVVGDASASAVDEAVDAVAGGDAPSFERLYRRLVAAGTAGFTVAGAAQRHFDMLHRARGQVERGVDPESALGPGVFWKRKPMLLRQVQAWTLPRIERALAIIDRTIVDSRLRSGIADEVVGQGMLMIAAIAARPARPA